MQTKVARKLPRILTVSSNSYDDIIADYGVDPERLHIVHVGAPNNSALLTTSMWFQKVTTTASADVAMKASFLLKRLQNLELKMTQFT